MKFGIFYSVKVGTNGNALEGQMGHGPSREMIYI